MEPHADRDFALAPEPWMREWVREMKLLWDDASESVARLVQVAWNPGVRALVGWFYPIETLLTKPPYRGRYVDTDRCDYALMSDIKTMHEEFRFWTQGHDERDWQF